MKEELLSRASELIEQRTAEIMGKPSGPRVTRQGGSIAIDGGDERRSRIIEDEWNYPGRLQVGSRVTIVPFCFMTYYQPNYGSLPVEEWVYEEAKINGTSLYLESRPSLSRRTQGGAVFLEKTWGIYTVEVAGEIFLRAQYMSANIIQQALTDPYPRSPGEVSQPISSGDVSVITAASKSYTLIGVYDANGKAYPGYMPYHNSVSSYTDPFDGGDYPIVLASTEVAPVNYSHFYA